MYKVQRLTADPLQTQRVGLPDGTFVNLTIYYVPMQFGWFITKLSYGTFLLEGTRITNSPNMLHQYKNQIPFGLACFTDNEREPTQQQDFSSGASNLYILTAEEVVQYSEFLSGQV